MSDREQRRGRAAAVAYAALLAAGIWFVAQGAWLVWAVVSGWPR